MERDYFREHVIWALHHLAWSESSAEDALGEWDWCTDLDGHRQHLDAHELAVLDTVIGEVAALSAIADERGLWNDGGWLATGEWALVRATCGVLSRAMFAADNQAQPTRMDD